MKGLCATIFYRKTIKGKLYPKAARTGPYAFADDVSRVGSKIVSKYIGIVKVPENAVVAEKGDVVETEVLEKVVESGSEGDADHSG